jgi:hypothetical protein
LSNRTWTAASVWKKPPRWPSGLAPNTLGESKCGQQSQTIVPFAATTATVRPSLIRRWLWFAR